MVKWLAPLLLLSSSLAFAQAPPWLGDEMPLPLSVKTPQDLTFKTEAERQFLIFNLMVSGKLAFEGGDYNRAVQKWQILLRMPNLPADVEKAVRPLLLEAQRAGGDATALPPAAVHKAAPEPITATVTGTLSGGGLVGPGAAVLWLRRLDGATPAPRPGQRGH